MVVLDRWWWWWWCGNKVVFKFTKNGRFLRFYYLSD